MYEKWWGTDREVKGMSRKSVGTTCSKERILHNLAEGTGGLANLTLDLQWCEACYKNRPWVKGKSYRSACFVKSPSRYAAWARLRVRYVCPSCSAPMPCAQEG